MSEQVTVKVLLKVEGWFTATPYEPDDALYEVLTFTTDFPGHVKMLLRRVFEQLNMPEPEADWAKEYRRHRHHRSLSVGDVVVVGESAFAVEPVGWKLVRVDAHLIWHDGQPMYLLPEDDDDWPVAD